MYGIVFSVCTVHVQVLMSTFRFHYKEPPSGPLTCWLEFSLKTVRVILAE